ncbi:LysR family transcriptional regulator [Vibrio sp. PP-XX7]
MNHLRAFYQLSVDKNYGVAAKHLFHDPIGINKKIKRLEEQVGIILFKRGEMVLN